MARTLLPLVSLLLLTAIALVPHSANGFAPIVSNDDATVLMEEYVGDDDDDDNGSCPGIDIVLTCCNLICDRDLGETEENCPEDCNDSLYWSYNQQTLCPEAVALHRPTDPQQVVDIVNQAVRDGHHVKAVGHRHSATDVICTDGVVIDMLDMSTIYGVEEFEGRLTVHAQAGVFAFQLNEYLHEQNLTVGFPWMGYNGVTIGGAVATGSHGSSTKHNVVISSYVASVDMVLADGRLVTFSEGTTDPETWRAVRANMGLLGVVVSLRLVIQEQFNVRVQVSFQTSEDEFFTAPLETVQDCDYGQANWFPGQEGVMITCGKVEHEILPEHGAANVLLDPQIPDATMDPFKLTAQLAACSPNEGMYCFLEWARYIDFINNPPFVKTGAGGRLVNAGDVTGPSHRMISSYYIVDRTQEYNFHQMDVTVAVPEDVMVEAMDAVRAKLRENGVCLPLIGLFFRFSRIEPDTFLAHSAAVDGDSLWTPGKMAVNIELPIHLPVGFSPELEEENERVYSEIAEMLIKDFHGRSHPGKCRDWVFEVQRDANVYGDNLSRFQAVRKALDPNDVFYNHWAEWFGV